MDNDFQWNAYADQPHNVGSRRRRFVRHWAHLPSYLGLIGSNLRSLVPILWRYRAHFRLAYDFPTRIQDPIAVGVTPVVGREGEVLGLLKDLGLSRCLLRLPSWEADELDRYDRFRRDLQSQGIEVLYAILQRRRDVREPQAWERFLREVFDRFGGGGAPFEVGHAWNRTKWGVWNHREYLRLARAAEEAARDFDVRLVGPAVIDFEFHLYPPLLNRVAFDTVSSLLYVDRSGAPEAKQFGWDFPRKLALLRGIVDTCSSRERGLWITEVNWPLEGTGRYSPAAGRPNVDEQAQADYLVRYYILGLCSGWVERIYWWQLVAPGYGLVDSRPSSWRKRPAFFAMKTLQRFCNNSVYQGRFVHPWARIFNFCKGREMFAVGWSEGEPAAYTFPHPIRSIVSRDGGQIEVRGQAVVLERTPKYIIFEPPDGHDAGGDENAGDHRHDG